MNISVIAAILKRNLVAYFSSPIGYVFICALVLLSAFAAFWPNEFFNANLASLDQLNRYLPWILLIFIPAVTMSLWAGERQQGTDELLLTLPARNLDVVVGKYLASLAIFTIALVFSLSNIAVLMVLGEPDLGLLAANYAGYWLVGAGMLAIGMVASFLTSNLTIGFILGAAFNAPLAFAASADALPLWGDAVRFVQGLSITARFESFGRGLITLSGGVYFATIAVVMLYLAMILIGRRHWKGRSASTPMGAHYAVRVLSLAAIGVGANVLAARYDSRLDVSSEKLSSLSPETVRLLKSLQPERPVYIEAYVSPEVPQEYVPIRLDLLSTLREANAIGGDAVIVRINETERYSEAAAEAEQQFGITARRVVARGGGKLSVEEIFLGVAFMSGLDKVVVPFFDRGLPVEYEVVRSIATVSQQQRRRVGVVQTDARLFGGFDFQTMARRPDQRIIEELRKQYEIVQVNAAQPIEERFDVLLAVQPSSLPQGQLDNLMAAIGAGQPTAIFEDPFPYLDSQVAPTSEPRRQPGGNNPFMQNRQPPPEPKGDIDGLWSLLGVEFTDDQVVFDDFNPYPRFSGAPFPREFVFVGAGSGNLQPFNEDSPITSGLQQVLLIFAGAIEPADGAATTVRALMAAGAETGVVNVNELVQRTFFGPSGLNPNRRFILTREPYTLAARIQGAAAGPEGDAETPGQIDVVLVTDIDLLYSQFFQLREQGAQQEGLSFDFDNVTFVLNVLDELAGDRRFIDIRKRKPLHRTLTLVEEITEDARAQANDEREKFIAQFNASRAEAEAELQSRIEELQQREGVDPQQMMLELATAQQVGQQRLEARIDRLQKERDRAVERIERDLTLQIRAKQNLIKLLAVALPPVPPLLVGVVIFFRRRSQERIGVPASRLG